MNSSYNVDFWNFETYTNKKRGVRGSPFHKAVLKVKEAKKIMKNVVTKEKNNLFKS